jgi:hypothetical protein
MIIFFLCSVPKGAEAVLRLMMTPHVVDVLFVFSVLKGAEAARGNRGNGRKRGHGLERGGGGEGRIPTQCGSYKGTVPRCSSCSRARCD